MRRIAEQTGVDRKTVRRYVKAAVGAQLRREGGEEQLTDEFLEGLLEAVRPSGESARGDSWQICGQHRAFIEAKLDEGCTVAKVYELLGRQVGPEVPRRTFQRFVAEEFGGKRGNKLTVRLADPPPGQELQVDFGRLGLLGEGVGDRNRAVYGLVMTASFSRHQFVWLTFRQQLRDVIEGLEAGWRFFGGVFAVLIPDNLKAVVNQADPLGARINEEFVRYAQSRAFVVDAARRWHPRDKARVERGVPYVRESFFRGEAFVGLGDTQQKAQRWCLEVAGMRIHGTTRRRPVEVFMAEEQGGLLPAPKEAYELPLVAELEAHVDRHVVLDGALYSVPERYVGRLLHAEAQGELVKISHRGKLIRTHPRQSPGGRSTHPDDYPAGVAAYALRDAEALRRQGQAAGEHVGRYVAALLEGPLPWTRMRHVYRLLGLVKRYGATRVETACARAMEFEVVDVTRIGRMLSRALETASVERAAAPPAKVIPLRFARSVEEFDSRPQGS
jgi:transposase